jgi:hypothetical protein
VRHTPAASQPRRARAHPAPPPSPRAGIGTIQAGFAAAVKAGTPVDAATLKYLQASSAASLSCQSKQKTS